MFQSIRRCTVFLPRSHPILTKKYVGICLRFIVSAGFLGWVFSQTDLRTMLQTWSTLDWIRLLASAIIVHLLCTALRTWRLTIILKNLGLAVSPLWLWLSHLRANCVSTLLPGNLGGDFYRTVMLARTSNQKLASASAIIMERLYGIAAMGILSLFGFLYGVFALRHPALRPLAQPSLFFALLAAFSIATAGWIYRHELLFRFHQWEKCGASVARIVRLIAHPLTRTSEGIRLLSVSLLFQLGIITWYAMLASIMELHMSFPLLIAIIPIVELFLLLPISIGGAGIRETAFSVLLVPLGVPPEQAISFALLSFTLLTLTRTLSGLAFFIPCTPQVQSSPPRQHYENQTQHRPIRQKVR
ncbi:MAG: UPF0104 family protein [Nitrospirae bacterium]|nr:MAG: UPF0104 family protein [Nitrospirota bacterium]